MYKIANIGYDYLKRLARDPNTSPEILTKIIKENKYNTISCLAAINPNCPPETLVEILLELLKGGNKYNSLDIIWKAARNPNTPTKILVDVLRRNIDDYVSLLASENPNTPIQEKIKWMRNVGKIGKEDPNKHIIEYDNKEEETDEDLEKLKSLVSSNKFNLKKHSQNISEENWYSIGTAIDTEDPEILTRILRKNKNDEVSNFAVKNHYCTPEILKEVLRRDSNNTIERLAALHPKCPPDMLWEILRREKIDNVTISAVRNPNCPPEALAYVLNKYILYGKYAFAANEVANWAAKNPNCPLEILIEILRRNEDDSASWYASRNPNIPIKEKIQWMRNTGKIGKEDPNKHIIEYEEDKPDEDLKKLRSLVSNNQFNLKKYSQDILEGDWYPEESWYTEKTAKNTKNPEILTKILRKNKDDCVSMAAADNPNCPPEILTEVLKRNKDDDVSYLAAGNQNCQPEILAEVLKRNRDDFVSRSAAKNPNTPPEILAKILRMNIDNAVSRCAARNHNCPIKEKIQWMRNTGKIGKEDPNKHIIEYDNKEEEPDEDLEKLRGLVSGNKFNLKKYSQDITEENWYSEEVAENTKDPEILTKILRKNKDDVVSWNAAQNRNCPSEILTEILRRNKDDNVSWIASENTNTPPEILVEVLRRNQDDNVSWNVAKNPNIPIKEKIKWMRNTGKITKEDPNKHIIEHEEDKPDEDLEKLRDLVSSNDLNKGIF